MAIRSGKVCDICRKIMIRYEENGEERWKCTSPPEEHERILSKKVRVRKGRAKGSKNKPRVETANPKFRNEPRNKKDNGKT